MIKISYTKVPSKSVKRKGQWYPRMYIKSPNLNKAIKPTYKDILFFDHANTIDKKSQNSQSQKLLDAVIKELHKQYKVLNYQEVIKESFSLKDQLQEIIYLKHDKSKSTIGGYKNLYRALKRFCEENGYNFTMNMNQINLEFIDKYRDWLVKENGYEGDTAYKYFSLFGSALKIAKSNRRMFYNPFDYEIEYPKKSDNKIVYLTGEEVQKMKYTRFRYERIKRAFLFMCYTGLRQGDCCNLTWADLPIINGRTKLIIKKQKVETDIFFSLPKEVLKILPNRKRDSDKVFSNLRFGKDENERLRMWAIMSGIQKYITPHTARHTFAFIMLSENNIPLYTLSKLLGHTDSRTTQNSYGHLSNQNLDEAMFKAFG